MKNFKKEIENSGMSFTEGGSYEPLKPQEIYLNLANCSEEQQKEVIAMLPEEEVRMPIKHNKSYCYLNYNFLQWFVCGYSVISNKTEVNFNQFKEIMGATVE